MKKKISIVIPVYNEIATIRRIVEEVKKVDVGLEKEIIIVDDASTDGTREYLLNLNDKNIKVLFHGKNKGKTECIKTALKKITGDIAIIQDADLEYLPTKNYKILLEPILEGWADVVYGSRFLGVHRVFYFWHYFANKFLTTLVNIFYDTMLSDMETGAKAFKSEVLKNMNFTSKRFGFEVEVTAKIFKKDIGCMKFLFIIMEEITDKGKRLNLLMG